ncbi:MAG: FTR1 family protein [Firmicutes bacterium]|nr:FTR1 family protein [Bacillota bacterium]
MFSIEILPGFVLGIREGLEAFLIIAIMLEYLNKSQRQQDKKYVIQGLLLGFSISLILGFFLFFVSDIIQSSSSNISKLWEFFASFGALILITTFIIFTLKSKQSMTSEIREKMSLKLSKKAIVLLATIMVAREGVEVVLFIIASVNQTYYSIGAILGVLFSGVLAFLIYKSLVKINLKLIFNITIIYLILQAGFMLGYSFHELFSYFKTEQIMPSSHWIYTQLFDLSNTFLDSKTQPIGIALYALIGWYSKPEIFQFIMQYLYSGVFLIWFLNLNTKDNTTEVI